VKYNIHTVHTNIDISIDPSINYLIQLFTSGPVRNAYRAARGNSYRCGRIGNYYPGGSKTTQGVIIYVVKTMETTGGWKL